MIVNKRDITEQKLYDALERLVKGEPICTKNDGKISIKRINDEACLSQGLIYSYKKFMTDARLAIDEHKIKTIINENVNSSTSLNEIKIKKLKDERDNAIKLKNSYREKMNDYMSIAEQALIREAILMAQCYELQLEINSRRSENVIVINHKK